MCWCHSICIVSFADQRLELCKASPDDPEPVKGQIIVSLMSRDGPCGGNPLAIVGPGGDVQGPGADDDEPATVLSEPLPDRWEERKANNGRVYYVNHITKSTQWDRPTAAAIQVASVTSTQPSPNGHTTFDEIPQAPAGPSRSSTCTNLSNGGNESSSRRHSSEILLNLKDGCSPSRSVEDSMTKTWVQSFSLDFIIDLYVYEITLIVYLCEFLNLKC